MPKRSIILDEQEYSNKEIQFAQKQIVKMGYDILICRDYDFHGNDILVGVADICMPVEHVKTIFGQAFMGHNGIDCV